MVVQCLFVADVRVRVEVEADALARGRLGETEGQVADGAEPRRVEFAHVVAEAQVRGAGQDVDRRPDQFRHAVGQPQVPGQVLGPVAPVFDGLGDRLPHVGDEFGAGRARMDGQAQRYDVGHHAGHGGHGVGAGGDRQAEDEVARTARAVQVGGDRGDQEPGEPGTRTAGHGVQAGDRARGQSRGAPQPPGHGRRGAFDEAHRFGPAGQPVEPVGAVRPVLGGPPVRLVGVDQVCERPVGSRGVLVARRVELAGPPREQYDAQAVDDDVVVALVPEHAVVGEPEHRLREQRPGLERRRPAPVGVHPRGRRLLGVGLAPQVEDEHVHGEPGDGLPRCPPLGREPDVGCLGLPDRTAYGRDQTGQVDVAPQFEDVGEVVGRAVRFDLLGQPDAGLPARQGHPGCGRPVRLGVRHGGSPFPAGTSVEESYGVPAAARLRHGAARAAASCCRRPSPHLTAVSSGVISSIAYGIDRTVLKENAAPMSGSW